MPIVFSILFQRFVRLNLAINQIAGFELCYFIGSQVLCEINKF